jgi:polyhydroxyalkanoate synthesis repressor PhaR
MQRVIKKYANRRLYDTHKSRYITLEELKTLIVDGHSVQIIDAKSKKDISREVLLQLVAEQESVDTPILNEAILTSMIQFYGHPMQSLASQYLQVALERLQTQRGQLREQMQNIMQSPADLVKDMTRQNMEWMNNLQQTFLGAINPKNKPESDDSTE